MDKWGLAYDPSHGAAKQGCLMLEPWVPGPLHGFANNSRKNCPLAPKDCEKRFLSHALQWDRLTHCFPGAWSAHCGAGPWGRGCWGQGEACGNLAPSSLIPSPPPPRLLPCSFLTVLPFQAPEMGTPLPQFPPNAPSLQGPTSPPKIHLLSPSPLRGLLFPFSSLSAPPPQFL